MGHVIRRAPIHLMSHASVTSVTIQHYHNLLKSEDGCGEHAPLWSRGRGTMKV